MSASMLQLVVHSHDASAIALLSPLQRSDVIASASLHITRSLHAHPSVHTACVMQSPSMGAVGSKTSIAHRPGWKPAAGALLCSW